LTIQTRSGDGHVKKPADVMEIMEAHDLTGSFRAAARSVGCDHKTVAYWGEIFGDEITAAAMVDGLVHHAEILSRKGDSYRLKDRDLGRVTPAEN
jgi:IstB-like ATP binding protein